ncbi:MAG: succinylglutamate desuccinylase/aspartoacylase family protein [Paenibacillus macerans]|uniref:Zinc carboxypeptidase family protein n=1 Tax=Paenibacillus macerans TaxID=44252 RepID=A0A090ZLR7_PAEMA|nr:succinylglutamate desuccinylase/aspartoacylase family protein [Paenibacillus macerans]KFN12334.1 zinc carboxypeptidase family protein [Paenibacillus macerans]MCY7558447.1 succinylglutamate desuccinylase/aspartoacylase family protein [Paenibacillus macerans]MDU7474389.1 succinylglutamate desuccinylase/aspartoacylase family protein [Paenibacillus macerans]MEC0150211.1 succinylglutamate desuccinylase/aspartoacylase family protein [Paenibacillus macerans]MEC0329496.1 succinylglutamate desucciny
MMIRKQFLAQNSSYKTPYYVIEGKNPGETVFITAGIHGNEIASIRAAQQLLDRLRRGNLKIEKGKLILVPTVNNQAYKKRIRGIPDLNRTFPRSVHKSAKHPLAKELFELAKKHRPNWYIDLHEANGLSKVNPKRLGQTLIINPGSKAQPTVRRIVGKINSSIDIPKHRFSSRIKHKEGTGRTAASRLLHAKAITVETCWSLPLSKRVHYQARIIHYFLEEANLMGKRPPKTNNRKHVNYGFVGATLF